MRAFSRSAAALLFAAALSSCGENPNRASGRQRGGTIVVSAAADVDVLVPPLISQLQARQIGEQIFDHLADLGVEMNTVGDAGFTPALAERWTWTPDSLSIAFHLNPRARWHDGASVRAEDVAFTFELYRDRAVASPIAPLIVNVDSVTVRDSLTAVAWFGRRSPEQFFDVAYQLLIVPRHLLQDVPRADLRRSAFARHPVGSGRFRFQRWEPSASLEIVADTANYRGRPAVDRVVWVVSPDFTAAVARLFAGEADVFEFLRPEQIAEMAPRKDLRTITYGGLDYAFIQFNLRDPIVHSRPHPIFGDRAVRVALTMGVDRASMVRNVFDTLAVPGIGPVVRGMPIVDTSLLQLKYDTAEAARALDAAGWRDRNGDGVRQKGARPLRFTLLVPSSSRNRVRLAVLFQEQLRKLGADVRLEQLEYGAFVDRETRRNFDAVFGAWHTDPAPGAVRQTWGIAGSRSANGMNYGSYESPAFDTHVNSALATSELATARVHFRRALETIIADAPAIWMYEPLATLGVHARLNPAGIRPDAWWAGLAEWTVDPAQRLPRDELGIDQPRP